jgi:hypothetical protein
MAALATPPRCPLYCKSDLTWVNGIQGVAWSRGSATEGLGQAQQFRSILKHSRRRAPFVTCEILGLQDTIAKDEMSTAGLHARTVKLLRESALVAAECDRRHGHA